MGVLGKGGRKDEHRQQLAFGGLLPRGPSRCNASWRPGRHGLGPNRHQLEHAGVEMPAPARREPGARGELTHLNAHRGKQTRLGVMPLPHTKCFTVNGTWQGASACEAERAGR